MAEAQVSKLVQARGVIKGRLTRIHTFLEQFSSIDGEIDQLQARADQLPQINSNFEEIQAKIESFVGTEEQVIEPVAFEESLYDAIAKSKQLIRSRTPSSTVSGAALTDRSIDNNTSGSANINAGVKLPVMNLPNFYGSYDKWNNFRDSFQAIIDKNHELSNIQKFFYLRSALKGTAAEVIDSLEASSDNYVIAWDLLKARFERKELIITHHVQALFDLPFMQKESGSSLRQFLDITQKHIRALEMLKANTWDAVIIHLLSIRLDPTSNNH